MKSLNWHMHQTWYNLACVKLAHNILNDDCDNSNSLRYELTINRGIRHTAENKIGPVGKDFHLTSLITKLFTNTIIDTYNAIPKEFTQLKNHVIFKRWVNIYFNDLNTLCRPKHPVPNTLAPLCFVTLLCDPLPGG